MKTVKIDGEIGYSWWTGSGVTAKTVKQQLEGIRDGEEIEVEIDSPGGSVYEGVRIFNLISVLLMLNLHFLRQAYKVYQEAALLFLARQYSCLLINAACNFSLHSASLFSTLAL